MTAISQNFEIFWYGSRLCVNHHMLILVAARRLPGINDSKRQHASTGPTRSRSIWVSINQQCVTVGLQVGGEVNCCGGFAYAAFEAGNGNNHGVRRSAFQ
jgi:hypothetical protein